MRSPDSSCTGGDRFPSMVVVQRKSNRIKYTSWGATWLYIDRFKLGSQQAGYICRISSYGWDNGGPSWDWWRNYHRALPLGAWPTPSGNHPYLSWTGLCGLRLELCLWFASLSKSWICRMWTTPSQNIPVWLM